MRTSSKEGTLQSGNSSVGRAQPCQGWGREFESRFPLQILLVYRLHKPISRRKIEEQVDLAGW